MQIVSFGDNDIININDIKEDENKIYCYIDPEDKRLLFLHHPGNNFTDKTSETRYFWIDLHLRLRNSCGGVDGYASFKEALEIIGSKDYSSHKYKLMIFNSPFELFEYTQKI